MKGFKKDRQGRLVYVEVRCAGNGGRCGFHSASVVRSDGGPMLVDHLLSDRELDLVADAFQGTDHDGVPFLWQKVSSCKRHGERLFEDEPEAVMNELLIPCKDLDASIAEARQRGRTITYSHVAWA